MPGKESEQYREREREGEANNRLKREE